jgi:aminoglycoside 3-N-acetyltransferase
MLIDKKEEEKLKIIIELKNLGIKTGDTIFIAADLLKVGYFNKNREQTINDWINLLLNLVGPTGTLVIPAYTESFIFYRKSKNIIYTEKANTTSGALSNGLKNFTGAKRSKHPTNSCVAIGLHAEYILKGHDEFSSSYLPYSKVIELNGKNLMLGVINDKKLAPMTMHAVQEKLGLTKNNWLANLTYSYYYDVEGNLKLFKRKDVGGCTGAGYKTIGNHLIENAISIGKVGKSLSAYIDCKKSYEIILSLYNKDNKIMKCIDPECKCCYGSPIILHPIFWLKFIFKKLIKIDK